ncbi:MAG: aromatic ring-hydroxylating dioxygenase subunit alpha [Verrucomicrobiae bacterium]|nr:aromatic ring-hydroxylating dioxygenase subunit alpha [Verrucomicrobiae bacterium]
MTRSPAAPEFLESLIARRRENWSLEQPFYTDESVFEADLRQIWMRSWLYAGHVSRAAQPGDYFLFKIGGESLVIIRDQTGQLQALFNVCTHRGSHLCEAESGHVKKLVCPYHNWVFDTCGTLVAARHMPVDFDRSTRNLPRAHVREVEGLVFVCLAEEPPSFDPIREALGSHAAPHGLAEARICETKSFDLAVNWKILAENFRECYHCGPTHPEYCSVMLGAAATDSSHLAALDQEVYAASNKRWAEMGLKTTVDNLFGETALHASRYPFRPGFVSQSLDGQPVAPVMGRLPGREVGALGMLVFPGFWFEASNDYFITLQLTPLSAGRTRAVLSWHVHKDAVEGKDYTLERVTALWTRTITQDFHVCELNQAGVSSSRYTPGPYAPIESETERFVRWYLDKLSGKI